MKHRFVNDGVTPIPMGAAASYACVCGKRGTREAIARHITESTIGETQRPKSPDVDGPYDAIVVDDEFGGGNTMAHYLPVEPRKPAPTGESPPLRRPDNIPEPLPPPPAMPNPPSSGDCPTCGVGRLACDLPEIAAWACGHWIRRRPQSIAELFQDMLRIAYQAGAASAAAGEIFEIWYQREVLR